MFLKFSDKRNKRNKQRFGKLFKAFSETDKRRQTPTNKLNLSKCRRNFLTNQRDTSETNKTNKNIYIVVYTLIVIVYANAQMREHARREFLFFRLFVCFA